MISQNQTLSEKFIREFQNDLDWYWISKKQNLSDNFIVEFEEKMNWVGYFLSQKPSYIFLKKYIYKPQFINIVDVNKEHLNQYQKNELEKLWALKYMFVI